MNLLKANWIAFGRKLSDEFQITRPHVLLARTRG
jgi:hypothetical protein